MSPSIEAGHGTIDADAMQVTYLMLNIWPRMMRQTGRKSCEETLRLVAGMGYTLHELAMAPAV